jgi:predicted metal-dependent hydrolase
MTNSTTEYDPRYLAGILFFNEGDYFESHEVWEALWMDSAGPERKFYQGLIQAAVALYHFGNGNLRGAVKLFRSSRDYLKGFDTPYLGLDLGAFAEQMDRCFAELLAHPEPERQLRPRDELLPILTLDPPPEAWPDLADYESPED